MRTEPCLCGDPECPRCFPQSCDAYAADMYLQALRRNFAAQVDDAVAHRAVDELARRACGKWEGT